MAVLVTGNEIVLSGTVGDLYWNDSFSAADVILALAQVGRGQDVVVRLNSGGGIATEGAAIHAALSAHTGRKTVIVEGIAASAASIIAMAGDEIVMALGAIMMIHDPSGFTFGTIGEHELQIKALTALATAMAGIYADRSGRSIDEARADMRGELWMSPEDAVAAGYADRVQGRVAAPAAPGETVIVDVDDDAPMEGPEPTAFDFRLYLHAPERLVALADQRAWTNRVRPLAALPPTSTRRKETIMTNQPAGGSPVPADPSAALAAVVNGPRSPATATTVTRSDASEIAKLCVEGGVPAMASALLAEGVTVAQARERVGAAGEIRNLVALARRKDPTLPADLAATMLAEGRTVEQARAALFDKLVANEAATAVASHVPAAVGNAGAAASATSMERELKRAGIKKDA